MSEHRSSILIGHSGGDHVRIIVHGAVDDEGWHRGQVAGRSGSFSASMICSISDHDLLALRTGLLRLVASTIVENWNSDDGEVWLEFKRGTLGDVRVGVRIQDFTSERKMSFLIAIDQSYLPKIIDEISIMMTTDREY